MGALINFDAQTVFKVGVSESVTVPGTVVTDSPTDNANFDSVRDVVGGQLICGFDDVAGAVVQLDGIQEQLKLNPGDIVACSAVGVPAANQVSATITSPDGTVRTLIMSGVTAVAGVIGYYA